MHLEVQENWHSCNPKDLRNRKVELQRKMKLSLGAVIYTVCFLNHFQPTNDHEIQCFSSIMFSSNDKSLLSVQRVLVIQEINSFHLVKK